MIAHQTFSKCYGNISFFNFFSLCSLWDQMVMILGLTGKTRVSWFPVSIARPIGVLSCFRMLGLFFSAVTEKLKVKSYQTILNIKDSQKAFADVNFKVLKKEMLSFNWNIWIYSNIRIYLNIRIYSNMFYAIRIYSYSY